MNNWISVKDRLPKHHGLVLVMVDDPICRQGHQMVAFQTGFWRNGETGEEIPFPVTHWTPLPDPPGEKERLTSDGAERDFDGPFQVHGYNIGTPNQVWQIYGLLEESVVRISNERLFTKAQQFAGLLNKIVRDYIQRMGKSKPKEPDWNDREFLDRLLEAGFKVNVCCDYCCHMDRKTVEGWIRRIIAEAIP